MRGRKLSDLVGCLILVLLVVVLAMVVFPRDTYADVRSTVLTGRSAGEDHTDAITDSDPDSGGKEVVIR